MQNINCLMHLQLILLIFAIKVKSNWSPGWFSNGVDCSKWDDSCKTWSEQTKWLSWEDYMYLDDISGKWLLWADGEYFDSLNQVWLSWDGKWSGYWIGQRSWFEWDSNKIFDLETMEWVTSWDSSKLQIMSSQYSLGSIWRMPNFYVDPLSSEIIELGTIDYPFKSMRAVSSDIINNFSYQKVHILIYLKENTEVYVSDNTNYFLDMLAVTLTSYSSNSSNPQKATLIPTQIKLPDSSKRSAFHILQNMNLNLNQTLSAGTFSSYELLMVNNIKATYFAVRTSFYIHNLNIQREKINLEIVITFAQLINLQTNWIDVRDCNFDMTGIVFQTYDPLNIYYENLYINYYAMKASLTGTVYGNNITVYLSEPRTLAGDATIFGYAGPANLTATNIDLSAYSDRQVNSEAGLAVISTNECTPNDNINQFLYFENATYSIPDNPYGNLYNGLVVFVDQNLYRSMNVTVNNFQFINEINS